MAVRRLIIRRDESIRLPGKIYEKIASPVNSALFQQKARAPVQIMNTRRNAKGTITAITNQNTTAEMALLYRDMIIKAARSVFNGPINWEGNESGESLKIHTVSLVRHMCKCTEALQEMRERIPAENEGVAMTAQVRWLSKPHVIKKMEQRGVI